MKLNLETTRQLSDTNQSKAMQEFQIYKKIYDIETITESKIANKEFFHYCKSKRNFVLILMYDNNGKIYLKESGLNEFCLPGGEIFDDETIMTAVRRILSNINNQITVSDVEPLAFAKNIFNHETDTITHEGIIMLSRCNSSNDNVANRFYDITQNIIDKVNVFANKSILELYQKRIEVILQQNNGNFQDEEIETNKKYKKRYKFHNDVIKKFILTSKAKKKKELLEIMQRKCDGCKTLIDVSCGDNSLLFSLLNPENDNNIKFIIANDISWSQIEFIPETDRILFTNHNAITMQFKENIFDLVYCSNTLHHIPNHENLQNLLENLLRIGKKIILYEIEDPNITVGFPYILNKYWYRGFLKDVGEQYLSYEQFKSIINYAYHNKANITFETFKNIQGNYMIAEITKKI